MPLYFDDIYTSRIKDTFIRIMSTKVSCINCGVTSSVIQNIKRYIYIPLYHSIEEAILTEFTILQFCNTCNNNVFYNCRNIFISYPDILTLVVRIFDNDIH